MNKPIPGNLWEHTCAEPSEAPSLNGSVCADVVIIGAGYTGAAAALQAARDGAKVCLLEAQGLGHGGSGRNVGLANAGLWLPPREIIAHMGHEAGTRLSAILAKAPDTVFGLIDRHGIACEPVRNGTLHCAHSPKGFRDLEKRFEQLLEIGAPVELLDAKTARHQVGSQGVHGALFDPRAGTIQPLAYVRGVLRAAAEHGAEIFANSPAIEVTHQNETWRVLTPGGTVMARNLIVATNGYHVPVEGVPAPEYVPVHFFQMATAPLSGELLSGLLPNREGCWDTGLVMSSWRLDRAGRMIFGGMGDLGHGARGVHLEWCRRKMERMFPALAGQPLEHAWCGRIAMTSDHIPKTVEIGPNALMTFGYSGRGIGPGTIFGTAMARALLSDDHSALPVEPIRAYSESLTGVRQAYYETGATLAHFVTARL